MKPGHARHANARGFSMIEVLIALVVTAFGLLGLAAFAAKATQMGVDATQRARASALLNDMSSRIANNKPNAALYAGAAVHGDAVQACAAGAAAAQVVARDLCEWGNLLAGANDGGAGAAFQGYRGCVTQPNALDPVFVVTVTWGSMTPGIPPADLCAQGVFGDDSQRRVIRSQVRVAALGA